MNEHYQALELSSDASLEEVKKSYRRLVKIYHPDRNPNDPEAKNKFATITNAYDELVKSKNKSKEIRNFTVSVGMLANYIGTSIEIEGHWFKIPRGIIDGDILHFEITPIGEIKLQIVIREQTDFTVKGRDLYTSLEVYEKDVREGKSFSVSNHPNNLEKYIIIPRDIQDQQTAFFWWIRTCWIYQRRYRRSIC